MSHSLPQKADIDIAAFAKTLSSTTSSYKFFWLLGLLEVLQKQNFDATHPILFNDIFISMLKNAKTPLHKFKLSFGFTDKLDEYITNIENSTTHQSLLDNKTTHSIKDNAEFKKVCSILSEYVPFKFISPFASGKNNTDIMKEAVKKFKSKNPPPYFIEQTHQGKCIVIHPLWAAYFSDNIKIIEGWCLWHFANFLQVRNPNSPAIINKITANDNQSRRLTKQRDFWTKILAQTNGMNCIYSGKKLSAADFALDHYVPWSFVGHDNMWNLVPICPSVNSSKSDKLPDNSYLKGLVRVHHNALVIREAHFPKKYEPLIDSYIADLKLVRGDITNETKLHDAYKMFIPPLIDLAKANSFESGWRYNSKTPLLERIEI